MPDYIGLGNYAVEVLSYWVASAIADSLDHVRPFFRLLPWIRQLCRLNT